MDMRDPDLCTSGCKLRQTCMIDDLIGHVILHVIVSFPGPRRMSYRIAAPTPFLVAGLQGCSPIFSYSQADFPNRPERSSRATPCWLRGVLLSCKDRCG